MLLNPSVAHAQESGSHGELQHGTGSLVSGGSGVEHWGGVPKSSRRYIAAFPATGGYSCAEQLDVPGKAVSRSVATVTQCGSNTLADISVEVELRLSQQERFALLDCSTFIPSGELAMGFSVAAELGGSVVLLTGVTGETQARLLSSCVPDLLDSPHRQQLKGALPRPCRWPGIGVDPADVPRGEEGVSFEASLLS